MIKQVEFNTKNENAFYGMQNTLSIFQLASKGNMVSEGLLESAWAECKDANQKGVLMSILMSVGDITGRQHNIFEGKVESGGNSQREVFRDSIIPFLVKHTKKKDLLELMHLITEYTTMDNILSNRVVTKKKSNKYIKTINMIDVFGKDKVARYCSNIILKGSTFQKICLAKFLTRPIQSKRPKSTQMLPETLKVMNRQVELIKKISDFAGLSYEDKVTYIDFTGFYQWKKLHNSDLESVLFSSGSILGFDKEQFINWLSALPSDARFRVRNRVLFDEAKKWKDLGTWYKEWETFKEQNQTEQRVLETKIANDIATDEDITKLKTVKKKAKVNVGAVAFNTMFSQIVKGTIDKIKVQPFLDRVTLPYNNLIFMDDSASMSWSRGNTDFTPYEFAAFLATICMTKNPDADARNLIGLFNRTCRMINGISKVNTAKNSLVIGTNIRIPSKPLIDSENHFLVNLKRMISFLKDACRNGSTNVSSIPESLNHWISGDPNKLEELQRYPIWTLISDGEFNNMNSAEASMNDFMRKCQNYFGFRPFILMIDVSRSARTPDSASITKFSGIDNLMIVPPNPAAIELFLTNFRDMDTFDVYTPLLSVYRSKRYAPIRDYTYKLDIETTKVNKIDKVSL